MNIDGLYMLNRQGYAEEKIEEALDLLYVDRQNEFRELSEMLLGEQIKTMSNWKEFVLNFSLDLADSFKTWSNQKSPSVTSPQKALTLLRKLGKDLTSMNQLTHMLNTAYNLAAEFKEIYKRLK